jgi:hypothetical protein
MAGLRAIATLDSSGHPLAFSAGINDETPGRELAVIGHPACDRQQLHDLATRWTRLTHLEGGCGPAGFQIGLKRSIDRHVFLVHSELVGASHEIAMALGFK